MDLIKAIRSGDHVRLKELVDKNNIDEIVDELPWETNIRLVTPLDVAIMLGETECVKILLNCGAKTDGALTTAYEYDMKTMKLLINAGADSENPTILIKVVKEHDEKTMRQLLEANFRPSYACWDLIISSGFVKTVLVYCLPPVEYFTVINVYSCKDVYTYAIRYTHTEVVKAMNKVGFMPTLEQVELSIRGKNPNMFRVVFESYCPKDSSLTQSTLAKITAWIMQLGVPEMAKYLPNKLTVGHVIYTMVMQNESYLDTLHILALGGMDIHGVIGTTMYDINTDSGWRRLKELINTRSDWKNMVRPKQLDAIIKKLINNA